MIKQLHRYVYIFLVVLILGSCTTGTQSEKKYYEGEPIITKKEYSLIPGVCIYTWEGWGRRETFEDKCDKYSVGAKITSEK